MAERLSMQDETLLESHGDHLQRYKFASTYCVDKRVLDAGCGIGYGSHFLWKHGAEHVTAVDISQEAIDEARKSFDANGISFLQGDLGELPDAVKRLAFGTIVHFENLEHLTAPDRFLDRVPELLEPGGTFITSTPNGELSLRDDAGRLCNPFHVHEYTRDELLQLLSPRFSEVQFFGQWLTYDGRLRQLENRRRFDHMTDIYFNPMMRVGRAILRLAGRPVSSPPIFRGEGLSYDGDYAIRPLDQHVYPWPPTTLVALCRVKA